MHFSAASIFFAILPLITATPLPIPDSISEDVEVASPIQADIVKNQYIMVYKQTVSDDEVKTHQEKSKKKLDSCKLPDGTSLKGFKKNIKFDEFKAVTIEATPEGIAKIKYDSDLVKFIEPDTVRTTGKLIYGKLDKIDFPEAKEKRALISQANPDSLWNLGRISHKPSGIRSPYSYDNTACSGTTVYVIDTGIWINHTEFKGRAEWGANFIPGSLDTDEHGHGTHCAGIVAGFNTGVCKQAKVVAVKVLSGSGSGSTSGVISGVNWAVDNAKLLGKASKSVISLSLGGPPSLAMDAAVAAAFKAGIFVAVAAGNEGVDAGNNSPARVPTVMTVGATDVNDVRPDWSNFGNYVDIHAPGVSIVSSWKGNPTGNGWYNTLGGTSMATPHVAAMAAYYMAKEGLDTPIEITMRLLGTAVNGTIKNTDGTTYTPRNFVLNNGNGL